MKKLSRFTVFRRVFAHDFRTIPVVLSFAIANHLVQGLFPAFTAIVLSRLFDEAGIIVAGGASDALFRLGIIYLAVYILRSAWEFVVGIIHDIGADKNQVAYRYEICQKLAKLPLIDFENSEIKDKHRRAEDALYNGWLSWLVRMVLLLVLQNAVNLVSVSFVMARYSLWFLPLCVLSVAPYLFARLVRGREFYKVRFAQAKAQRKLSYLWGLFTNRRTLKELRVSGADEYVAEQWKEIRDKTQEEIWVQTRKDTISMVLCDILRIVGYGACIALALKLTLDGTVSVGVFGACIAAFVSLQSTMRAALEVAGHLPNNLSYAGDYIEFIDLDEEAAPTGEPYDGLKDEITLQNLSFRYPNAEEYAVSGVSFTLRRGEKLAILGENGSGKTTLTKLLLGMLPPDSGAVLYDGKPASALNRDQLRRTVSAIAQTFTRYELTLRENVAMSDPTRMNDDNAIISALQNSGLGDLLDEIGLDTELGNAFGGSDISGGQWQKLAIARGLFRDSELIVLDEPTSALDPLIETEILTKFVELARGRTAVIISHRVGLCRLVDRIAVMKNGELAELGTHNELMQKRGVYYELYTAQEKWYK